MKEQSCRITNAFPYLKPGGIVVKITDSIMSWSIKEFLIPQINIIKPKFVLCLGYNSQVIKRMLFGFKGKTISECINANNDRSKIENSIIFCQYHPAARVVPARRHEGWEELVEIMNNSGFKL